MYSVVIVDGNREDAIHLKNSIDWKRWHCRVIATLEDGPGAFRKIKQLEPHIVITEILLDGFNGLELIQRLSGEQFPHQCIIVSMHRDFKWAQKGIELGVKGYLIKPIRDDKLGDALNRSIQVLRVNLCTEDTENGNESPGMIVEAIRENSVEYSLPVRSVIQYVDRNLYSPFTMGILCDHLKMNQAYISKLFKKETGLLFSNYLRLVKMNEARRLLANPSNKVYQIAELLGYQDYPYFFRIFKQTFGYAPTALRSGKSAELSQTIEKR